MKQRYDNDFLIAFTTQRTITLITSTTPTKTNRDSIIHFKCIGCTNDTKKGFRLFVKLPYCKSCGNDQTQAKIKETCLEKYGFEHPFQNADVQAKRKQTFMEKYGCENPLQNADVQAKRKETCLEKYGCENPSQNADVQATRKETCLEKYGCEHPLQNADVADKASKNAYKSYDYKLPSGKIVRLQGYEKYAIDKLLSDGITEMDIVTDRSLVPKICYTDQDSKKKRRYFIDIFIPSMNTGIEVKSTWTFEKKTQDIMQKQQAFKDSGYTCEIWVLNNKGEMVTVHK